MALLFSIVLSCIIVILPLQTYLGLKLLLQPLSFLFLFLLFLHFYLILLNPDFTVLILLILLLLVNLFFIVIHNCQLLQACDKLLKTQVPTILRQSLEVSYYLLLFYYLELLLIYFSRCQPEVFQKNTESIQCQMNFLILQSLECHMLSYFEYVRAVMLKYLLQMLNSLHTQLSTISDQFYPQLKCFLDQLVIRSTLLTLSQAQICFQLLYNFPTAIRISNYLSSLLWQMHLFHFNLAQQIQILSLIQKQKYNPLFDFLLKYQFQFLFQLEQQQEPRDLNIFMSKREYKNSNNFDISVFPNMEVILITPNAKYETLVSPSKMIQNTVIDILPLLETQVFLNHHYNVSFFILKNNFPYQFHYPLKIAKHLLDRNEGPVQLSISNGLSFKIQSDTDTLQILSNVQSSLQGVQSEQHVVFLLKYWEVKIRLVVLNQAAQLDRIKQAIQNLSRQWDDCGAHDIMKTILYVDDSNYQQFLLWSQNQNCFQDYCVNQKLSKQYMSLKQEIDNEKNSFRNKIKMVEAILGENINIDKLLSEEKQQNLQYKRLRQTFETIKNIDNVIIQQERKIQSRRNQLKQIILSKHSGHYENAKLYAKRKSQISQMAQLNDQLRYKIQCVSKQKGHYFSRRNFELNTQIKEILDEEVNRCKNIVKNMGFLSSKKRSSNYEPPAEQMVKKSKILKSMHESNLSEQNQLQTLMKKRVDDYHKTLQMQKINNDIKEALLIEMKKYQTILRSVSKFYENSQQILNQIRKYSCSNQKSLAKLMPGKNVSIVSSPQFEKYENETVWSESQFIVLNQLISDKPTYFNVFLKKHFNESNGTKIASNLSINQKFADDDRHFEKERISRVSMLDERPAYRTSITRIKSKHNKIMKVTGRPSFN